MEQRCGPYTLLRKIASGGMADVYLARAPSSRGQEGLVALKMVAEQFACDEEFIESLMEEAALSVRLRHPNIASIFDLGRVGDRLYLPMELVDGKNAFELLVRADQEERFLPIPVAAWIARETAAGLEYAHRLRDEAGHALHIIHRDISPQNILLSWQGDVKLCDFGIAKAATRASRTQAGVIKGKFSYMSPEQASGLLLDQRTDIFSLGICLWELVCGEMLYQEEATSQLLQSVRAADIPKPSRRREELPEALEKIILHTLEPNPEDRYASAGELASDLDHFLRDHAPGFTSATLAALMGSLFPEVTPEPTLASPSAAEEASHHPLQEPSSSQDSGFTPGPTRQLQVLQAEDFTPDLDHSVIFSADDLAAKARAERIRQAEQDLEMADDPKDSAPGPEATRMLQSEELLEQIEAESQADSDAPPRDELDPTLPPGAVSVAEVEEHLAALQQQKAATSELAGATMMLDMRELGTDPEAQATESPEAEAEEEASASQGSGLAAATVMLNAKDLEKMMQEQGGQSEEAASPLEAPPEEEAPDPAYAQKTAFMSRDDPAIAAALEQAQALANQGASEALPETIAAQAAPITEEAPPPEAAPKKTGIKVKKKGVKVVRVGKASAVDEAEPPAPEPKADKAPAEAQAAPAASPKEEAEAPQPKATPAAKEESKDEAEIPTAPGKKADSKESAKKKSAKKKSAKKKGAKKKGAKKKGGKSAGPPPSKMGRLASTKPTSKFEPAVILTFVGILLFGGLSLNYALALMFIDYGTLKISSEPAGAHITLDGKELGKKTPHTVKGLLVDQPHSVTLSLKGYIDETEEDILVSGDQETRNHYELRPVPGSLEISSKPSKAQVYIDGEMRCARTPCTVHDLPRDQDLPVTFKLRRYQDKTQVHVWMSKNDSMHVRLERQRRRR